MAVTKQTWRVFQADLRDQDDGTTAIVLTSHDATVVHDSAGRRRWSHEDDGRSNYTEYATLTIREAAKLLNSLADSIGFVAVEEHDAAHPAA